MLFGKLHNPLVNYGLTDEEYSKIRLSIVETNRKNLNVGCYISMIYMIGMTFLSIFVDNEVPFWLYVTGALCAIITVLLNRLTKKHSRLLKWLVYIVILDLLGMGILMGTLFGRSMPAVAFHCFLIISPLIFSDRPYRICSSIIVVVGIFIFADCMTKEGVVLITDISNALIFGSVSFVLSIYLGRLKIDRFVKEQQVYELANFDLLTSMQNRNCYTNSLTDIKNTVRECVYCLYIDADNLHDINNQMGHEEGDIMLKSISQSLLRHLDLRYCYRVGGDEFVCFLLDFKDDEVECITSNINDDVESKGYHISIGIAKTGRESLDMTELVRNAELSMYEKKKEYYESIGKDYRNH